MTSVAVRPRVLVVDDLEVNRLLAGWQLERLGIEAVPAADGPAAIEASADVDAVLLDLRLPGMDGFEIAGRIHAERPGLPIVAFTADALVRDEAIAAAGISRKLTKPVSIADLRVALEPHLRFAPAAASEALGALDRLQVFFRDGETVGRIVDEWLAGAPRLLAALETAADAGNVRALADAASALRESTSALGLPSVVESATRVQRAAAEGRVEKAEITRLTTLVTQSAADLRRATSSGPSSREEPVAAPTTPSALPSGLDELTETLGEQAVAELVGVWLEELPRRRREIRAAIGARTPQELREAAHSLKSATSAFGTSAAMDAARRLEESAHGGAVDAVLAESAIVAAERLAAALRAR